MAKKGIIFLLIAINNILCFHIIKNNCELNLEVEKTANYLRDDKKEESEDYLGVLEIPSLNITKGFYSLESEKNTINKNVTLISGSSMPNETNGNIILAAHRGNSNVAFFNNLNRIKAGDNINIYFKNKKYVYAYTHRYDVEKNGKIKIIRNKNATTITLITCKKGTNKQTVFIGYLIDTFDM